MSSYDESTPVLIVGGGYAGLASSLFLAEHGVRSILVDRHDAVSIQGRARGVNQRTMELYRPLRLDKAVLKASAPFASDAGVARCSSLAAEWEWLFDPEPDPATALLSPASFCMADQSDVEPHLMAAAASRGAEHRFGTEMLTLEPDADGITAMIRDRANGTRRTVRAEYLIAADGYRGGIRDTVGIPRTGPGVTQHWVSIVFDADLGDLVTRRALFWIVLNKELGFASFVTTAIANRWAVSVAYDPTTQSLADFTRPRCAEVARVAVGRPDLVVDVVDIAAWEQAVGVADRYRAGRVFLVGDSAHVWPPAGAMGANSAVQDAHNLAWKLAAVIKRRAGDALLDSYEDERRPVALELARLTVARQAARFGGTVDNDVDDTVCTLGQRYRSTAILGGDHGVPFDGTVADRLEVGTRVPHVWLEHGGERISTHDLFHDSFVLLTGPYGLPWLDAAAPLNSGPSTAIRAYRVGPPASDAEIIDIAGEWPRRGTAADQAALIRPDGFVAWLSDAGTDHADERLRAALGAVLRQSPMA